MENGSVAYSTMIRTDWKKATMPTSAPADMAKIDISAMPPADDEARQVISESLPPATANSSRPVAIEAMTIQNDASETGKSIFLTALAMWRSIRCPRMTPLKTLETKDTGAW